MDVEQESLDLIEPSQNHVDTEMSDEIEFDQSNAESNLEEKVVNEEGWYILRSICIYLPSNM